MDKKLNVIFLIAIMFCSLTATAQKASELPLADPFILVENGTYYAYGTHSEDGIEVYTSKDLKTWQLHG